MASHDKPIPRKKKEKSRREKPKSDQASSEPSEYGHTYGIVRLNLAKPANDSENESEGLLAQRRQIYTTNKEYINNSTKCECNVLLKFLNPTKRAKSKTSNYSTILQG